MDLVSCTGEGWAPAREGELSTPFTLRGVSPLRVSKVLPREHFHFATTTSTRRRVKKRSGYRDPLPPPGTRGEERTAIPHFGAHTHVVASLVVEPMPPGP